MYTFTKITDSAFNGEHPNGINEGYTFKGKAAFESFKVGYPAALISDEGRFFITSAVTKVEPGPNENSLYVYTENSKYLMEKEETNTFPPSEL